MRPDFGRNLLVDREDRKPRLMAIDFGMAFPGVVTPILGSGFEELVPEAVCHQRVRHLLAYGVLKTTLSEIENMPDSEVVKTVRLVPEPWLSEVARANMVRFLLNRRGKLRECLERYMRS
jgi:hypothetical protein